MKKILILSLSLVLLSAAGSAQQDDAGDRFRRHRFTNGFHNGQITRPERHQLRKDHFRYKMTQHRGRKAGFVGPIERRRLHKMRRHNRHEMFRFKHNRRHRVI